LALSDCDRSRGAVDGAWWPKSFDLGSELPDLVAVFGRWIGPIHRVVYDPSVWLSAPSRVNCRNAMISVDPYRLISQHTIFLMGTHSRDAVLYVISPSSTDNEAQRLLRIVTASQQSMGAGELQQMARGPIAGLDRREETAR
jgi:hypothetical protein